MMKRLGKIIIAIAACSLLSAAPESKAETVRSADKLAVLMEQQGAQNLQQSNQMKQQEARKYGEPVSRQFSDAKKIEGVKGWMQNACTWDDTVWLGTTSKSNAYLYILKDDKVHKTIDVSKLVKKYTGVVATNWINYVSIDNTVDGKEYMCLHVAGGNKKKWVTIKLCFDNTGKCVETKDKEVISLKKTSTGESSIKYQYKNKWYMESSKSYKAKKAGQTLTLKVANKENDKYKTVKTNVKSRTKGDEYYLSINGSSKYGIQLILVTPKKKIYCYYSKDGKNFKKIKRLQGVKGFSTSYSAEGCTYILQSNKKIGFYMEDKPNNTVAKVEYKVKKKSRAGVSTLGPFFIVSTGAKNYLLEENKQDKSFKKRGTISINANDIIACPYTTWTASDAYGTVEGTLLCKNGKLYVLNGIKNMKKYTLPVKCKTGTLDHVYFDFKDDYTNNHRQKIYICVSKYADGRNSSIYVMDEIGKN